MIFWVMGASCSGKKTFITKAAADPARYGLPDNTRPAWINDGDGDRDNLIERASHNTLLIRWQWNREKMLKELILTAPNIEHTILLCKAMPSVQVARVIAREGSLIWPERNLIRECEDVQHLAEQLSMEHRIPIRYIDSTKE